VGKRVRRWGYSIILGVLKNEGGDAGHGDELERERQAVRDVDKGDYRVREIGTGEKNSDLQK